MLAQRRDAYQASEGRVSVGYCEQAGQLVPMKAGFPWLELLASQALQQTLLDLDQAFARFFEGRSGYPAFKRRGGSCPGLCWPQGVEVNGRCVWLPKLGWVKARFSRRIEGTAKNVTVRFDGLRWHLDQAFARLFEGRSGYPAFKRRGRSCPVLCWPQGVEFNGRCVWLPKLGWVKARFTQPSFGSQ